MDKYANIDTSASTPVTGLKLVVAGWLINGVTTRSVVTNNDSGAKNIGWYVGNGGTFALQTDFTPTLVFAKPQRWYEIESDPNNRDRLIFTLSDNNNNLFAKRLVITLAPVFTWTDADSGAALEVNLALALRRNYGFAFWRAGVLPVLAVDIVNTTDISIGSPSVTFPSKSFSFNSQTSTATLGSASQKIKISNGRTTANWNLSLAATAGATAAWSNGGTKFCDFNDPTSGVGHGLMQIVWADN